VGRGYTDHAIDWVIGVFDEYTGNSKGASSSARGDFRGRGSTEQVGLPPALQALSMGLSDSGVRGAYDKGRGPTGAWDGRAGRVMGTELKDLLSHVDQLGNVLALADDDVEPDNRVVRSALPPDEHDPISKVVFEQRRRTERTQRDREFSATGRRGSCGPPVRGEVLRIDFPSVPLHVHSAMRMGTDPADSVLDAHAEARWVDRLFVGDNWARPTRSAGDRRRLGLTRLLDPFRHRSAARPPARNGSSRCLRAHPSDQHPLGDPVPSTSTGTRAVRRSPGCSRPAPRRRRVR
jgi:hypothetical protein